MYVFGSGWCMGKGGAWMRGFGLGFTNPAGTWESVGCGSVLWWCGGVVVWWCGGVVVWWCGGVVVWWCGGVVVWWCG